ncbi:MAG: hypothetical protein R3Y58_14485, partial [Eubacteriales bacterium]
TYTKAFDIVAVDTTKVVVYAKFTDGVGHVSYISSDGLTFDTTMPVVEGVSNLGMYQTDLSITVTDTNLDTVTLNGENVEASIQVDASLDATYVLVATDLAGNTTTYTFYTYVEEAPVEDVLANLPTVDATTTEEEKEAIKDVVNNLTDVFLETLETTTKDEDTIIAETNRLEEALLEVNDKIAVVAIRQVIEGDVEEDKKAPEAEITPQGLAVAIYGSETYNAAIKDGSKFELSLSVTQTQGDGDYLVFEIKPMISIGGSDTEVIPNSSINAPVTFKLYLNDSFDSDFASIEHVKEDGSSEFYEKLPVGKDEYGNYVTLTVYEFSNFIVSEYVAEESANGAETAGTATETTPTNATAVDTGDHTHVMGWIIVLLLATMGVVGIIIKKRKIS